MSCIFSTIVLRLFYLLSVSCMHYGMEKTIQAHGLDCLF
ncbi:hypothetical protein PTUN_a2747 [Pseudoalteromonas tunicata]|nr:hypothetical protein PTUN_a2747 [Pseudoalteromonas tunicata]